MRKIDLNNFQVATNEMVRDINSRIVLNLVRKHQPVSRADLMRYSGLQRSTVSAITERLIVDRWLREGAMGNLPRGRKPTFLHLNTDRSGVVGVDIQASITTLAAAGMDGRFLARESMPTERNPVEFINRLGRRISKLMQVFRQKSCEVVGVGVPGRVDSSLRQVVFAPTLGWSALDLKTQLERNLGLPVELENVANACALSELWWGQHLDSAHNLVVVTVADDLGVGMIMNGGLVRGSNGAAGEFEHMTLIPDGPPCRCGNTGCWESLASNAAAVRYYTESSVPTGRVISRCRRPELSFGDILQLADRDDVLARKALERMAHYLGEGIAMLVTGLAPDALVVVGEITRVWAKIGPIVTETVKRRSFTCAPTRIIPANPESDPRLRGAMALVLRKHFDVPVFG